MLHNNVAIEMVYENEICNILKLLQLFPSKPAARGAKRMKIDFEASVSKMLVFAKVIIMVTYLNQLQYNWYFPKTFQTGTPIFNALKEEYSHPYILLFGPTQKNIRQYFIVVDHECINVRFVFYTLQYLLISIVLIKNRFSFQVPAQFTFTEVFDLFFKAHYVFNVSFDESIDPMMMFIKQYFYKIRESKYIPTPHMARVFNDISCGVI